MLIIDDTFTQGASVFSATAALRAAGATVDTIVVIGRHFNPTYGPSAALRERVGDLEWDVTECVKCRAGLTLFG